VREHDPQDVGLPPLAVRTDLPGAVSIRRNGTGLAAACFLSSRLTLS